MRRARRHAALPAAVGCLYRPPNEKSGPETIGRGVRFGVAVLVGSTVAVRNFVIAEPIHGRSSTFSPPKLALMEARHIPWAAGGGEAGAHHRGGG